MKKHQLTRKQLKYFAKMAAEAYVNDPVHSYVTKNEKLRKKIVYHFMIERLSTSAREDIIYIDEENRGICVWREAYNEYSVLDFLRCPNWFFLYLYWPKTIKTLMAYSHLDVKVFPENTLIISPVFVDPMHQGKGVASALIRQGISDLTAKGYKLGLEAQDIKNVKFYEKLGFKVIKHDYWKRENVHNYYMMYQEDKND
jgi:predicted N-acetyltransferase YhbS